MGYVNVYKVGYVNITPSYCTYKPIHTDLVRITFGMKVFWTYGVRPIPKLDQSRSFYITYKEILK